MKTFPMDELDWSILLCQFTPSEIAMTFPAQDAHCLNACNSAILDSITMVLIGSKESSNGLKGLSLKKLSGSILGGGGGGGGGFISPVVDARPSFVRSLACGCSLSISDNTL